MPYTPPSNRSPPSSTASSPSHSRRSSFTSPNVHQSFHAAPAPPALPRSSSYLARHRAAQAAVSASSSPVSPVKSLDRVVRQSPPPITDDRRTMPAGAIFSPPESPNSSDDESRQLRGRRVDNTSTTELKELHAAISQLPTPRRSGSPGSPEAKTTETLASALVVPHMPATPTFDGMRHCYSTSSLDHLVNAGPAPSKSGRRVSHVRSATEPSVQTQSDDDADLEIFKKPQMVRKKSGELVRPALRLGARSRPSSMPGTPTFSKVVHFDSHLEHVRHFLQVDRPLAVSAGSSPVETYDSESEYPFGGGSSNRQPPFEWEIQTSNFPVETPARKALPVRLERVWLSADQKMLHGSIAVLNLAFAKSVTCRFTLDYWKTTSEIAASYSAAIVPPTAPEGHDRFNFSIRLSDLAHLESKTMFFCVRYAVNGQEHWDNNNGSNFQLDFKKKLLPMNGKNNFAGLQGSALPRSHHRRSTSTPRPKSMPASLDFESSYDQAGNVMFDKTVEDYLGEKEHPTLRLKSSQSSLTLPSDNIAARLVSPSGQAFANRYDFGASLSAAKQSSKDTSPSKTPARTISSNALHMKPGRSAAGGEAPLSPKSKPVATFQPMTTGSVPPVNAAAWAAPAAGIDRSISSKSYEEILKQYCFYVPKPMATKEASARTGTAKSAGELVMQPNEPSPASSTASDGSPVQMGRFYLHGTQQPVSAEPASLAVQPPPSVAGSTVSNSPSSPASPASLMYGSFGVDQPRDDYGYMKDQFPFGGAGHSPAIKG